MGWRRLVTIMSDNFIAPNKISCDKCRCEDELHFIDITNNCLRQLQ